MTNIFSGRAGIVTGASSGIGRLIAITLAEAGMEVWLVGRSEEQLKVTADSIANVGGPKAHCAPLDLTKSGELAKLVLAVADQHPHLFTLINCAGIMHAEPITETDDKTCQDMFAVNLFSPIEACNAAVHSMRKHKKAGQLINISSIAAKVELYGGYTVSKAALDSLGTVLRKELEHDDIRVTTISLGAFGGTELGRDFSPEYVERFGRAVSELGEGYASDEEAAAKFLGDPQHVANLVKSVLTYPPEVNLETIVIRPPLSLDVH